jgi:asparagine synthase (glutamine-hydrolysing)
MCGIAGYVDGSVGTGARQEAVGRMCDAMLHRGPDDAGIESDGAATIGMRRLAIFDPANGHQPMSAANGRFRIVFNGAIYNFRELRAELSRAGLTFKTECDTEVLLAAYLRWGERCLPRLRGMFAFAVWDAHEQSLFFARDPFGIKPLYYRQDGGRLLFASEINALIAARAFVPEIDPASVGDYLGWFAVPAPRTIYRGIVSLRPGECARFQRGQLSLQPGWSFRSIPTDLPVCATRDDFIAELRHRLDDTIRAHVVADVPVGAFLSGGLDSAVVVGLMTRATGARLKTFSIGFDEAGYSEAAAAEATARHFGTEHRTRVLTGAEVARDLGTLLASLDQPTGDGLNTYYASQTARAGGVTVALSGLGGDELLGGYPSFRTLPRLAGWLPLWRMLPPPLRRHVLGRLRRRDTRWRKLADLLEHAHDIHDLGALHRLVFSDPTRRSLLSGDARRSLGDSAPFHPELMTLSADLAQAGAFEIVSAWELRTYMADVLLRDSDVMSMRHSLELRVPFVDRPLIEWLWRQPSRFKDDRHQPKSALFEAVHDLLPPALAHRKKQGFSLPFGVWMRHELRPFLEESFSDASVERSGLFARDAVQRFWRSFLDRNDTRQWSRVWSLAILIHFANRRPAVSASTPPPIPAPISTPPEPAVAPPPARPGAEPGAGHRTLLLAPEIFTSEGGIPRILQLYLKALCDLAGPADQVRLVALNDAMMDSRDLRRSTNDRLDDWYVCGRKKARFIRASFKLSRGCDRIVCGHVAQLPVALAAKTLNPRVRYYLVAHGIEVWRKFKFAERLALRGAERIFCVSDYTRRELLRYCPLPEGKAVVLHNALDPYFQIAAGAPFDPAAPRPVILAVTRLTSVDRYKGVEHLVRAMTAIRAARPDAILRIIGRGDDLPRLQSLRRQLGLDGAVEFLGYVDDRRMTEELRACALFALPSKKEGFGLVFLEAMAHGRPCLGAQAGGIPEVITPDTGILVDYGNVPAIAAACVGALHRRWDEAAILARARHFSYPQFRDRLGALLSPP